MQKIGLARIGYRRRCARHARCLVRRAVARRSSGRQRPVKFIVPLGPGSGIDIGTRLLADRLTKRWGQPIVVENRPGGDAHRSRSTRSSPPTTITSCWHRRARRSPRIRICTRSCPTSRATSPPVAQVIEHDDRHRGAAVARGQDARAIWSRWRARKPGKLNWAGTTGAIDFLFAGFLKNAGLDMAKMPYRDPVEALNDVADRPHPALRDGLAIVRPQVAGRPASRCWR